MNRPLPAFALPPRTALAATVAGVIRQAITAGSWQDYLPTERRLSETLQVSRPTLRVALHLLAKEGLIEILPGHGTRVLGSRLRRPSAGGRLVTLIAQQPVLEMGPTYQGVSEMRAHLAKQGFDTEVVVCQSPGRAGQRFLESHLRKHHVFCCALLSVGEKLQRWFADRAIPTLVLGSCHPDVRLPSLDFDNRLVCRHAAGVLLQRGHRRLALLLPDSGFAGDLVSEQGFREAVAGHRGPDVAECRIVRHDGTAASITRRLDALLRPPAPVTAVMTANIEETFIVMMHLLSQGIAVPERVSLIARDHSHLFELMNPSVAHYRPEPGAFEHRLSRLVLQMVAQGHLAPEPTLIVPKFFPGGTVRTLR